MLKKDCSMEEVTKRLEAPFSANDIEWRVSRSGNSNGKNWAMVLAYVTNRAIQNRLDEVFGPAGWKNDYKEFMGGILCTISCYVDGEWVSKSDGAELTAIESLKGGLSSAMKRCGSQWKIGRYLYNLTETYVEIFPNKQPGSLYMQDKKNNVKGYWFPPKLPDWALPLNEQGKNNNSSNQKQQQQRSNENNQQNNQNHGNNQNQQNNQNRGNNQNQQRGNLNNQQRSNGYNNQQNNQNRSNGNNPQNNQNQQKGSQNQQDRFNRNGAVSTIKTFLNDIGLMKNPGWVMPLFKRINPNIQQITVSEVFEKASQQELQKIYNVLRPVADLKLMADTYKVRIEDVLQYVQIICPTTKITDLISCIGLVKIEYVKASADMIKSDINNGSLKQTA
ncbi:Rad52/Rad22 family DNA repair protein [Fictibacillus phosphorivorans]|uniref:Rad52/Rad22 family DNA repair protein n=1 Tax=Fictibacillus phosphorivorans TaxID=1221500 RepID=UPI001E63A554|nr:Rad52/Rad22 family DNA repair protein [Fictibacillus phosphorivorans]